MQVHRDIRQLPSFNKAIVTIGTFDGVHTGHQQIIAQLKAEAETVNGETVIITFHPHPRKIITHKSVFILTTLEEKITLFATKGIDHLVVVSFDDNFSHQTPYEYVHNFLYEKFHPHTVIIGYDHRFGRDRQGDYHMLDEYGKELGFIVKEIPEHFLHAMIVSSTRIRQALLSNDIDTANEYLGYDYFFQGKIVEGNKLGRTIGYPTANIYVPDPEKLIPGNGVYAVEAELINSEQVPLIAERSRLKGMMNIGVRPTIDGTKRVIEVNIFDFNRDIYGQLLRVYMKHYLRGEVKFNGLEELKDQLAKDKKTAIAKLL